jgi:hypothetical protein
MNIKNTTEKYDIIRKLILLIKNCKKMKLIRTIRKKYITMNPIILSVENHFLHRSLNT